MEKLFLVEDEPKLRRELAAALTKNGYSCIQEDDFTHVVEDILSEAPDLVLLDINLPVHDGFYICRELRKVSPVPVIMVTSRDSDLDEVMSLNTGADDFISKPYNLHVLLARIAAVLKRSGDGNEQTVLNYEGVCLQLLKSKASYAGKEIDLTKNELEILKKLITQREQIVSRDELIRTLWEQAEFVEDGTLTVNINRLRRKLESIGLKGFLTTRRGQGYMVEWKNEY
ncbi:response regulator transcription factor [Anaerovorax odorimutans]|uniref:Stage 0 sporulation protein A homolog n=1 Tax=Anaerovorax odorimutans TaxID=109327 RepID=A0ABT1RL84_9FIRM|nr:response regulator transcription factor [Anaerovorax odorimutans]MCQ4635925.1 response regulator transcription factor [Anaerovorax odorimutans]